MGSCQAACTNQKNAGFCGYGKDNKIQALLNKDVPERAAMQKNRRWNVNQKTKSLLSDVDNLEGEIESAHFVFEDEKVQIEYPPFTIIPPKINVIEQKLFKKFNVSDKNLIFGYVRHAELLLNDHCNMKQHADEQPEDEVDQDEEDEEDEDVEQEDEHSMNVYDVESAPRRTTSSSLLSRINIPNNIHYLVLLYYYLMEKEFENEALELWNKRGDISEFMNTTLESTRTRMWDKFDKHKKGILSTEKYLPKLMYTVFVLYLKSKQRKSIPPKYAKVKNCTKYMALLMVQALPIDQKRYIDKQHFVANIHVYLSSIC